MPRVGPESTLGEVHLPGLGAVTIVGMMDIGQETAKQVTGETSATGAGSVGTLSAIAVTAQGQTAGWCCFLFIYLLEPIIPLFSMRQFHAAKQ